ncbi:hypothetical protein LTS10_007265 [Elasticomyces elasticus]|nr:hypothetical protein LTS10_007265 [Elasticomyces elasticus]
MATSSDTASPSLHREAIEHGLVHFSVNQGDLDAGSPNTNVIRMPRYRPLDQSRFEIRLLEIKPQTPDETHTASLTCRLICVPLINPPEYIALSYCWGTGVASHSISINGEDVAVTTNLLAALQELRQRGVRLVWADAICINQADLYEKAAQIQLMGRIYARARRCVAWLGTSDVSSSSALAMLNAADSLEAKSTGSSRVQPDAAKDATLNSVNAILARPYWQRKWILQEIAKARSVQLWCGPDQVDLERFLDVLLSSDRGSPNLTSESRDLLETLRLLRTQEQKASSGTPRKGLAWALVYTRRSRVTDPRDAIHSLLGLTSDGLDLVPTANYVESAADVFAMTSWSIINRQNHTVLLLLARRNDVASDSESTGMPLLLPSWVPDFAKLPPLLPPWVVQAMERADKANQGASITPSRIIDSPLRSLTVVGVILGRVDHVEGRPPSQAERSNKLGKTYHSKVLDSHSRAYEILIRLFRTTVSCSMILHPNICDYFSHPHASVFAQLEVHPTLEEGLAVPWFESVKSMIVCDKTIEQWVAQHRADLERMLEYERHVDRSLVKRLRRAIISPDAFDDRVDSKRRRDWEKQELSRVRAELEQGLSTMTDGNMRLVVTSEDEFLVAYTNVRPDDLICLLKGCSLRVILRSTSIEGKGRIAITPTTDGSCHAVLNTTELLEGILLHLPAAKLVVLQRVSRRLNACITESMSLQRHLFRRRPLPDDKEIWTLAWPPGERRVPDPRSEHYIREIKALDVICVASLDQAEDLWEDLFEPDNLRQPARALNPLLKKWEPPVQSLQERINNCETVGLDLPGALLIGDAWWKETYLTTSACKKANLHVGWIITRGKRQPMTGGSTLIEATTEEAEAFTLGCLLELALREDGEHYAHIGQKRTTHRGLLIDLVESFERQSGKKAMVSLEINMLDVVVATEEERSTVKTGPRQMM